VAEKLRKNNPGGVWVGKIQNRSVGSRDVKTQVNSCNYKNHRPMLLKSGYHEIAQRPINWLKLHWDLPS